MKRLLFGLLMAILAVLTMAALTTPVKSQEPPEPVQIAAEIPEDYENEKIECALLAKAHKIENCTVTWYTASVEECGKDDGITYSGLPVVEHLTCAVDKNVIPLYADVFVRFSSGDIEQYWATDTGVIGNSVDIYTGDYDQAIENGRQVLEVWWLPGGCE